MVDTVSAPPSPSPAHILLIIHNIKITNVYSFKSHTTTFINKINNNIRGGPLAAICSIEALLNSYESPTIICYLNKQYKITHYSRTRVEKCT